MHITCVSDLHGYYPKLEGGDLLIVAGDLTAGDEIDQYVDFYLWLSEYLDAYKKIVIIAGNHDNRMLDQEKLLKDTKFMCGEYLCDSGTEFEGLKIWGSPWTKTFEGMNPKCKAFTVDTEQELADKFSLIPDDTDILITHSPPIGVLDRTVRNEYVGSVSLSAKLGFLENLKIHVFGHIHEAYGKIDPPAYLPNYFDVCKHYSVNCSHVNERYEPVNKPVRIEL